MLIDRIQAASVAARKAKDAVRAALLVTLFSEAARHGKDAGNRPSTDDEVLKTIKAFLKGIQETLDRVSDVAAREKALAEKAILEEFMPSQVSGAALAQEVAAIVATLPEKSPKQMGSVMATLKQKLGASYDGKEASALVKAALQ